MLTKDLKWALERETKMKNEVKEWQVKCKLLQTLISEIDPKVHEQKWQIEQLLPKGVATALAVRRRREGGGRRHKAPDMQ